MKTNLFFGLALLSMAPNAVSAQENADSLYIRNSVYMLKLDMPADNEEYAHAYEVTQWLRLRWSSCQASPRWQATSQ